MDEGEQAWRSVEECHEAAFFLPPPNMRRMKANRTFFFGTVGDASSGFTGSLALSYQSSRSLEWIKSTHSSTYTR